MITLSLGISSTGTFSTLNTSVAVRSAVDGGSEVAAPTIGVSPTSVNRSTATIVLFEVPNEVFPWATACAPFRPGPGQPGMDVLARSDTVSFTAVGVWICAVETSIGMLLMVTMLQVMSVIAPSTTTAPSLIFAAHTSEGAAARAARAAAEKRSLLRRGDIE